MRSASLPTTPHGATVTDPRHRSVTAPSPTPQSSAGPRTADDEEVNPDLIFGFENLLYEIRRDLGHENKGLGQGDLLVSTT